MRFESVKMKWLPDTGRLIHKKRSPQGFVVNG